MGAGDHIELGPALKYNRALEELASAHGEVVSLAELMEY